jgi:F-type H+-transporting ATPase subunit epsilon
MADGLQEKSIRVTVITPVRTVLDQKVWSAVLPAFDGEWAIFPGHAAFMALLGCGRLTVSMPDGQRRRLAIRGGFLQVRDNVVTVLTPQSARPEELDASALAQEQQALSAERPTEEQREAHQERLAWLRARQRVLESTLTQAAAL